MLKCRRRTETGEAPRSPGATTENTGQYLREEQRRERGCIARRMQPAFHHGLLSSFRRIEQPVRVGILLRDNRDFDFHRDVIVHIEHS